MPSWKLHTKFACDFLGRSDEYIRKINEIVDLPKKHEEQIFKCIKKLHPDDPQSDLLMNYAIHNWRIGTKSGMRTMSDVIRCLYGSDGVKIALLHIALDKMKKSAYYLNLFIKGESDELKKRIRSFLEGLYIEETEACMEYLERKMEDIAREIAFE